MTDRSLRQIYTWRLPPNWSRSDWREEMEAEATAAACEAQRDFDPTRGVPLAAFIHQRVLARALTRYRREWAYGRRWKLGAENDHVDGIIMGRFSAIELSEMIRRYLDRLPVHHRRLLECVYWEGKTEAEVARLLCCSQPAINMSKRRILEHLRREMDRSEKDDSL
jgi:RNA polymerase sigma factor (sigma-70 family)